MSNRITVRVYGILINDEGQLLVSDELIRGGRYTKFPGGGLEWGEGTRDCLVREFEEEMNLKIEVLEHLYTTDFFQESAFRASDQIFSVYYRVQPLEPIKVRLNKEPFEFDASQMNTYKACSETESFRFIPWADVSEESVTLPIDKVVVRLLREAYPTLPPGRQ